MNNQKLSSIAMQKSGHKRSRFNFSHDVNTTADFGSVQPAQVRLMTPYTKGSMSTRSLTRLAPMVAPAFGRVKLKLYHEFVACKDICKTWDAIMSQTPQYSAGNDSLTYRYTLPNISLGFLSSMCLIGAKCTVYKKTSDSSGYIYTSFDQNSNASVVTEFENALSNGLGIGQLQADSITDIPTDDRIVVVSTAFGGSATMVWPLSNAASNFRDSAGTSHAYKYDFGYINLSGKNDNNAVTLEEADQVFEFDYNSNTYAVAFRLGSVGKRVRKILIGCGYQVDLSAKDTMVNFMPIMAFYKAYWNLFGLTQWQNYETTTLAKLIDFFQSFNVANINHSNFTNSGYGSQFRTLFGNFVKDLCMMFYTDTTDYVSSHLPSTAVSPTTYGMPFVDVVAGQDNVTEVSTAGSASGVPDSSVNGHSFISQLQHGELDSEYLKRLYKWTNRNTIIGRRIGEILRSQGLGKYVDSCKTDFIGYTEDYISISDVVSTADTQTGSGNNSTGKLLGEYGGRGLQLTEGKTFTYENDEYGYWITLMVIVPECGYMQQIDPSVFAIQKFGFYNPEFDSLGYEAQTKRIVQGARDWNFNKNGYGTLDDTYGYAPRYFGFKFAPNVNNGDITLRGVRSNYLPYTLDKFIDVGSPRIVSVTGLTSTRVEQQLVPLDLPIAGNAYRYIGRYPWLGNFNRIFANVEGDQGSYASVHWNEGDLSWWFRNAYDNFLISSIFNFIAWSPMLAVEDSFETEEEEGQSNMKVDKA